jgi:fructose-1,6-bisphosphatase/inositol monophosphatase family enzyme
LQEAGGMVTDFKGANNWLHGQQIIGSNQNLSEETLLLLKKYF